MTSADNSEKQVDAALAGAGVSHAAEAPAKKTARKAVAKKPGKRGRPPKPRAANATLSLRFFPDQREALDLLSKQADRSLNGQVAYIITWYFKRFTGRHVSRPRLDYRPEDILIYKEPAFQFRAAATVVKRIRALASRDDESVNRIVTGMVDEYLRYLKEEGVK